MGFYRLDVSILCRSSDFIGESAGFKFLPSPYTPGRGASNLREKVVVYDRGRVIIEAPIGHLNFPNRGEVVGLR